MTLLVLAGCSGGGGGGGGGGGDTTASYTVSGVVNGLFGAGLVLQNSGKDDLAVAGPAMALSQSSNNTNLPFTFATPVANGGAYALTVQTQPSNPTQVCSVANASGTVSGANVTAPVVTCTTDFTETFAGPGIDGRLWEKGEYSRAIVSGALEMHLAGSSIPDGVTMNTVSATYPASTIHTMQADVNISSVTSSNSVVKPLARILGSFYHTATPGEAPGDRTGDVNAVVGLVDGHAVYTVNKCLNHNCNLASEIEFLVPGGTTVDLGVVPTGTTASVLMDWDYKNPGLFTFSLNGGTLVTFDPVAAGAPISQAAPNAPFRALGVRSGVKVTAGDTYDITATFDNVMIDTGSGPTVYDDFGTGTYIDRAKWNAGSGGVTLGTNSVTITGGQDSTSANGSRSDTILATRTAPSTQVIEGDVTLVSATNTDGSGTSTPSGQAWLHLLYDDPATVNSALDSFTGLIALQGVGATPTYSAILTVAHSTNANFTTADSVSLTFPDTITPGTTYHLKLEHTGGANFRGTLCPASACGTPTPLNVNFDANLPVKAKFNPAYLASATVRTRVNSTNDSGDAAAINAKFENVKVGP